jgi:REP element-mobilizing transposase RayT
MMTYNVLVITPQAQFGEMIRLTLEETALYRVRLVPNGAAGLASCHLISFAIAIIDCDLPSESAVELAQQLRIMQPALKLMLIPPGNNPHHPLLNGFEPDGFIEQPFFIPEMLEQVANLTSSSPQAESSTPLPPPWLDDQQRVAQVFGQVFSTLTAQAGIIVRGKEPWCPAGNITPGAARELTAWLSRYTAVPPQTDLARFFHINSDALDVLIYAVTIASGVILALVFPPGTALSRISSQARQCAFELTRRLASDRELPEDIEESPLPSFEGGKSPADLAFETFLSRLPPPEPTPEAESSTPDEFLFPWEMTLPQPEPQAQPDWVPYADVQPVEPLPDAEERPSAPAELPPIPEPALEIEDTAPVNLIPADQQPTIAILTPELQTLQAKPPLTLPEPPPAEAAPEDTQPVRVQRSAPIVEAPAEPQLQVNPVYTCILLPCRPEHTLYGPAADILINWLPQLCLAFNWNLLHLEVNLDYLQWQVQVAADSSPNAVVRTVRKLSSQRLFNLNPRYQAENTSGDFWAPGFLIISGGEPPSPALVRQHIQQTRRRQGLVN